MKPRVSITMPVLNGAKYIDEAIESIASQTYKDFELIVVDDGSTDETPEHVKRFSGRLNLKYVRHPERRGISRSVNDGIRQSAGEFIAFLDHDDGWLPEFLETQVTYLDQHPDVGMVHSDFKRPTPTAMSWRRALRSVEIVPDPAGVFFPNCLWTASLWPIVF